jgi:DMSO reductase anchor subunit
MSSDKCPHFETCELSQQRTEDIHILLGVIKETLIWHKRYGWLVFVAFVALAGFVLLEALDRAHKDANAETSQNTVVMIAALIKDNTKQLAETTAAQKALSRILIMQANNTKAQGENIHLLNKNIVETSITTINLTTTYMGKLALYEVEMQEVKESIKNLKRSSNAK